MAYIRTHDGPHGVFRDAPEGIDADTIATLPAVPEIAALIREAHRLGVYGLFVGEMAACVVMRPAKAEEMPVVYQMRRSELERADAADELQK